MAGIVLVTKPPFLFPPSDGNDTVANLGQDYFDRNFALYDLKVANWTSNSVDFEYMTESSGDLYFVGAIIALCSAIFSALYNIVIAKLVSFFKNFFIPKQEFRFFLKRNIPNNNY